MSLSFFISDAMAEGAAPASDAGVLGFIPLIIIFIIFYFLIIRPQVKRAKNHKKLTESISKGDEVITGGGLLGKVIDVNDNFVSLEITEGTIVKIQRQSVSSLVPKGTIKTA